MSDEKHGYVTTAQLQAELRGMRWEMRALILLAGLANLGLGYKAGIPGVAQAVGLALSLKPW